MTIKTNEFWTNESFEDIIRKIKLETRQVKFGVLNSFPKSFEKYPLPWVGEINERAQSFKLFRVKGSENTSDLSVIGNYSIRGTKPVVVVKHRLHFTVFFGMFGLFLFVVAVFYLLQKKNIDIPIAFQVIALLLVVLFYAFTIIRDLRQDEKEIERTLTRVLVDQEEIDDDDEEIEDEDE
jgi:hypothetical protein